MLALDSKVDHQGWTGAALMKVAGLRDLADGVFPIERMALDLRDVRRHGASAEELLTLPWASFVADRADELPIGRPGFALCGNPAIVKPGDVVEIQPWASKVAVRYRRGDTSNVLFATERCNSYCLMCSQPPRQVEDDWRVEHLCTLIELIDKDSSSLAVSGGEPTLLGPGLARIIRQCANHLPVTPIHVLSNGRRFSESGYAAIFIDAHPLLSWGIPLYGDHYRLHDYVVQREGAFAETVKGIYALHQAGQHIEIRVVLVKPTVERLPDIVRYIYRNLPFVEHVALMGTEPIGFAKAHRDDLWLDPVDMGEVLTEASEFLNRRGIAVSLFNLPLCTLPKGAWPFAQRSISDWKQDYLPQCEGCQVRKRCAGFFSWVTPEWTSDGIRAITKDEVLCEEN